MPKIQGMYPDKIKFLAFLVFSLIAAFALQSQPDHPRMAVRLQQQLAEASSEYINILIVMNDQLDFERWENESLRNNENLETRQKKLVRELKLRSENSGTELYGFLTGCGQVDISTIKRHWIVNGFSCMAKTSIIDKLAGRPDVKWVGLNGSLKPDDYETAPAPENTPVADKPEKGLLAIGADKMWKLGYTGYGRLAFIPDTGTDPTHPAIATQYNGLYRGDKTSWFTFSGSPRPGDCDRHGTHVTGTILGLDRKNNDTIGVAFNARWIAGGILCGIGTEDNLGAFEWALDPDGNPDTTDDIPDVINNSWYDPQLTTLDCYSGYVPLLQALELAGVAVVFSAGNAGPEPETITPPHNININVVNSFTVGALNGNVASHPIASFSSIGPSHCPGEGSLKIKPEVSAPGVQVRSCVPDNGYDFLSGTSMASPHVAGAVLLLKEAFPYLGGRELKLALYESATDLGDPGEDNKFGMGIINVYHAYLKLMADGHVPVPGHVNRDAVLLDIKTSPLACGNTYQPELTVENAGMDTITQLAFTITGPPFNLQTQWTGLILPGERKTILLAITDLPVAEGEVEFRISAVNGEPDHKELNNLRYLKLKSTARQASAAPLDMTHVLCQGSDTYLSRPDYQGTAKMSVRWYDDAFDGKLLGEGDRLYVRATNVPGPLFAELSFKDKVGADVHNSGEITYPELVEGGLTFDAEGPFMLDSVSVYSKVSGIRDFYLYNEQGDSVTSSRKFINKPGINNVKLGWNIPAGKNYRIINKAGKPLGVQTGIQNFPITSSDQIVTIKHGTDGDNYNIFYNWRISYLHPCGRVMYPVTVRQDSVAGNLDFSLSADTLSLPDQNELTITDHSTGIERYTWDMGDGSSYTSRDVIHSYSREGKYDIILAAVDSTGCPLTAKGDVTVFLATSQPEVIPFSNIPLVRPNPVVETLFVDLPHQLASGTVKFEIMDSQGKQKLKTTTSGRKTVSIDVSHLPQGLYILRVKEGQTSHDVRFIRN